MILTKNEHGYYEVRLKGPDGKYKSRSTGKKNREEAKEMIREAKIAELELAAEMGVLNQDVVSVLLTGKRMTVLEALEPWREAMMRKHRSPRSIENSLTWVKAWASWANVEKKVVSSLKASDFDGWVNAPGKNKLGTRKVMLSAIRSFCDFCTDNGWMMGNPANLVGVDMSLLEHAQKETTKRECFTEEEVDKLISETSPRGAFPDYFWHAAIVIGRYTGLRLGDICCMEWDCIQLTPGKLTVWTQKRDKRVELPIEPKELKAVIDRLWNQHSKFVFPREREIILDPKRRASLSVEFSRLKANCGIGDKTFHCLRATYVTDCKEKGMPIEHISQAVGHSNPFTTMGYVRPQK